MPPLAEVDVNRASNRKSSQKGSQKGPQKLLSKTPSMETSSLHDTAVAITQALSRKRPLEEEVVPETDNDDESENEPDNEASADIGIAPDELKEYVYNCNQVRTKINAFLRSGEMKVGEFQDEIGVSGASYYRFLAQKGPMKGLDSDTYDRAHDFFLDREKKGLKMPRAKKQKVDDSDKKDTDGKGEKENETAKKTTTSKAKSSSAAKKDEDKYDVSEITLPGEAAGQVPIFDTCQDIRTKIRAHLRLPGITQAGFCRTVSETYKIADRENPRTVSATTLSSFLAKKGPRAGNTSTIFYAAYVYFEKLRVKQGKSKTKKREEMEKLYKSGGGMNTKIPSSRGIHVHKSERPHEDQYGVITIASSRAGGTRVLKPTRF